MSQHQYAYSAPVAAPRHYSAGHHGTSSAFSSSANPDEDWTKISDLAERRRIQNRIAQRNYRKKLKRRLEDLERRASDESSEPGKEPGVDTAKPTRRQAPSTKTQKPQRQPPQAHAKSQHHHHDEYLLMPLHDLRDGSHTPPLYSSFSAYAPPSGPSMPAYGHMQPFMPVTTLEPCPAFLSTTAATTLPPMTRPSDDGKGIFYAQEDPFASGLGYGFIPGMNVDPIHHYDTAGPHTPPLSQSFDHSADCSEAGYEYPTTPLSVPASPPITSHHGIS